jgi:predicted metalloprotease with PDZ domain
MKKQLVVFVLLITAAVTLKAQNFSYKYTIHLENLTDDKALVELTPPKVSENTIKFCFPKMVPGTYEIYDFGRYIDDFTALDAGGSKLQVTRLNDNAWQISNATQLAKITYRANDTYDAVKDSMPIFEPAGSNFEDGKNYVLSMPILTGYFEGSTKLPYEITVLHKPEFYGSTAGVDADASNTSDRFLFSDYNQVVDNPIMYSKPDTANVKVGNCNVLISVYSPKGKVSAKFIALQLDTLLQAEGRYLGGTLPVDKYAFLIYLSDHDGITGGMGALEHSYSSMYFLPEMDEKQLAQEFRDIAAHEFLHILTPLNIHSVEIADFDFDNPKMSEHLWLYEGSTEYNAFASQLKGGIMSFENFVDNMHYKIYTAAEMYNDTLPFTEMSKGALDTFKEQYGNVYEKGALIGWCLDIKLLRLSKGQYCVANLIKDLSKTYGTQKAFNDNELFDKIAALTYPEIKTFLQRYVASNERLPFEELLPLIGVSYTRSRVEKKFSMGSIGLYPDPESGLLFIYSVKNMNEFGKALGYKKGDAVIGLNGKKVHAMNYDALRGKWLATVKEGDNVKVKIIREVNGKNKKMTLKATAFKADVETKHEVVIEKNPSAEQQALRSAFMGPVKY